MGREVKAETSSGGSSGGVIGAVLPILTVLRANRRLRARRPEIAQAHPRLREAEISHWRGLLGESPSLGAIVDQVYDQELARWEAVSARAQRSFATSAVSVSVLCLTIALPAIGQMFAVSPWFVIAALFGFTALLASVRANRCDRPLLIEIESLAEPIDAAQRARGEIARDVLLVEVRSRRAAAMLHNRAVAERVANLVDAATANLRNAFIALLAWIALDAAPMSLSEALRNLLGRHAPEFLAASGWLGVR